MDAVELDRLLDHAKRAARAAGTVILDAHEKRASQGIAIKSKGGVDMVTATDKASERLIFAALREATPHFSFVGEETVFEEGQTSRAEMGTGPTWVVDPLDGTTNFVHGVPLVCVCIGLLDNRRPVLGVVYNPFLDELYEARLRGGARCNGQPIHVATASNIAEALIVNNIGASRDTAFTRRTLARLEQLMNGNVRGLRNFGSAAVNMCFVARGALDAYFEDGYGGPWDVVAAASIVEEAGGVVCELDGSPMEYRSLGPGRVLCGNRGIAKDMAIHIRAADRKRHSKRCMELLALGPVRIDLLHVILAWAAIVLLARGARNS